MLPRRHHAEDDRAPIDQREPAAVEDLARGSRRRTRGRQRGTAATSGAGNERRPLPALARDHVEEHRRDRHRAGDRDAVRRRQIATSCPEPRRPAMHAPSAARSPGHVDLALGRAPRCGRCSGAGRIAELHGLRVSENAPGDQRLRGDDRRHGRDDDQRVERPAGTSAKNGFCCGDRAAGLASQQERALAEVVEQQRREDDAYQASGSAGGRSGPCPRRAPRRR